jgi:hypothetical protein
MDIDKAAGMFIYAWIKDLSEPDRLFMLKQSLPVLGNEINLLPIFIFILNSVEPPVVRWRWRSLLVGQRKRELLFSGLEILHTQPILQSCDQN